NPRTVPLVPATLLAAPLQMRCTVRSSPASIPPSTIRRSRYGASSTTVPALPPPTAAPYPAIAVSSSGQRVGAPPPPPPPGRLSPSLPPPTPSDLLSPDRTPHPALSPVVDIPLSSQTASAAPRAASRFHSPPALNLQRPTVLPIATPLECCKTHSRAPADPKTTAAAAQRTMELVPHVPFAGAAESAADRPLAMLPPPSRPSPPPSDTQIAPPPPVPRRTHPGFSRSIASLAESARRAQKSCLPRRSGLLPKHRSTTEPATPPPASAAPRTRFPARHDSIPATAVPCDPASHSASTAAHPKTHMPPAPYTPAASPANI